MDTHSPMILMVILRQGSKRNDALPRLGWSENPDTTMPYRVYVLACGSARYVGICGRLGIKRRIARHFAGDGSAYTATRKPTKVLGIWPCPNRAAEAYVFYALAEKNTSAELAQGRLGGWTQTLPNPTKLGTFVLTREKRMLAQTCLDCGGDHLASKCKSGKIDTLESVCANCGHVTAISNQGASWVIAAPPTTCRANESVASAARPQPKPKPEPVRPPLAQARPAKRRRVEVPRRACLRVSAFGEDYTSLPWFFGGKKTGPTKYTRAFELCWANALELKGCDTKILEKRGFATMSSQDVPELVPGRRNLPADWLQTVCKARRGDDRLQVRRARASTAGAVVLYRKCDLDEHV